jgi:hypothetical protein
MIACNFLFNFIPKEFLCMKNNNSSEYKLNLNHCTVHAMYVRWRHVTETVGVPCRDCGVEGLKELYCDFSSCL